MEEREINIKGLKASYKVAGEGQPVLILHGWGGSSDSWLEIQKILSGKEYKVIVPDLPGFGKTDLPEEAWGVDEYDDFVLKLTEKLNLDNFFLLGHSFGGQIAVKFAVKHREKIKKLILCDSAAIRIKPGVKVRIIFWLARMGNAVFGRKHLQRLKDNARNLFYLFLRNRDYVKAKGTMRETIKKVLSEDLSLELPRIKVKTLIVWGAVDKMVPLKCAYMFKERIVGSELEILPKIGHSPHLEDPLSLSNIILKFLKNNG